MLCPQLLLTLSESFYSLPAAWPRQSRPTEALSDKNTIIYHYILMLLAVDLLLFSGSGAGGFMSPNTSSFPCTALYNLALGRQKKTITKCSIRNNLDWRKCVLIRRWQIVYSNFETFSTDFFHCNTVIAFWGGSLHSKQSTPLGM